MEEIWKDVAGYEGLYQVSNMGGVKRLSFITYNKYYKRETIHKENHLRPTPHYQNNYLSVMFSKNKKQKRIMVHRLVAIHFISNPNNYRTVNHKNGNKQQNCVSNLEWMSHKQNVNHAIEIGLMDNAGENNGQCKITEKEAKEIKNLKGKLSSAKVAQTYGLSSSHILRIWSGKKWAHI